MRDERRVVAIPDPAAGGGFTFPIGGAVEVEVLAVSFVYSASAAVANRVPRLDFVDSFGNVLYRAAPPFTIAANNVSQVSFGVGCDQYGANNALSMGAPLPAMRLYSGLKVVGSADLIAAGDTLTGIRLFVRQFPVRYDSDG